MEEWELNLPKYLQKDIKEYLKEKDNPKCTHIDCLLDELYSSINIAYWDKEITKSQADYLRKKYIFGGNDD